VTVPCFITARRHCRH